MANTEETKEVAVVRREMPSLAPRTFAEAVTFAKMLEQSSFIPAAFKGKSGDILAAIQFGFELGVGPMQALQNIAVINGKPSVYGDLALALVQASGKLAYLKETDDGTVATCIVRRVGDEENHTVTFSNADAAKAGLAGKTGPWTQYPQRMRMFRARGFALRDKFADVLKGLITREEAEDYPPAARDAVAALPAPALEVPIENISQEPPAPRATSEKSNLDERKIFLAELDRAYPDKTQRDAWLKQQFEDRALTKWGQVTVGILLAMAADLRGDATVDSFINDGREDSPDPSDSFELKP